MKKLIAFFIMLFSAEIHAQDLKGLWQGYITAEDTQLNSGYLISIENQNNEYFSGRAYIYRHGVFDGHLDFIGTSKDSVINLTELRVLKYRTPPTWFVCVKFCNLDFMHRNSFDHLTGDWKGSIYDGTVCSPGEVILRRYNPANPDGIEPIPATVMAEVKKNEGQPMRFLNTELGDPVIIPVQNRVVQFELRDYMREDNDTVSVYFNRNAWIKKERIAKRKKTYTVRLDRFSELNEFILYAENLGEVPPNTSVLTVIDGEKKHRVIIESTRERSAVIYLRYQPPEMKMRPNERISSVIMNTKSR